MVHTHAGWSIVKMYHPHAASYQPTCETASSQMAHPAQIQHPDTVSHQNARWRPFVHHVQVPPTSPFTPTAHQARGLFDPTHIPHVAMKRQCRNSGEPKWLGDKMIRQRGDETWVVGEGRWL